MLGEVGRTTTPTTEAANRFPTAAANVEAIDQRKREAAAPRHDADQVSPTTGCGAGNQGTGRCHRVGMGFLKVAYG